MFHLNVGGHWNFATEIDEVRAGIFLASKNASVRFSRASRPELKRVLLDPQLYLAGLDRDTCAKTCANLASHAWFGVDNLPEFDSGTAKQNEWKAKMVKAVAKQWPGKPPEGEKVRAAARSAIEYQLSFGCTHVILPTPLLTEREDEGGLLGEWIDAGIEQAQALEVGQSLIASIAVDENVLSPSAFNERGFLDALIDQVTAREGLDGVYVVVAQKDAEHPFKTSTAALRAYLKLSAGFRSAGLDQVIVNFADVFGLACMAVGATDFATGQSQALRRLSLAGFRDESGGIAVPHFYSHKVIGEFASESDLKSIIAKKLLRRIEDETAHSMPLLGALRRGGSAGSVPSWAESQNNLRASQRHFLTRMTLESRSVTRTPQLGDRRQLVRNWLEDADANYTYLQKRLKDEVPGRFPPLTSWIQLLDEVEE